MTHVRPYFFCGIGGSGMMPLALIVQALGNPVQGSDRSRDQGRTPEKFAFLQKIGVELFAQTGEGLTSSQQKLIVSTAVEDTIPDVQAARQVGAEIQTRAQLLSELFNQAPVSIGVAGTSGKSTTTGMIAWILSNCDQHPTVMNGAVMKNFVSAAQPFASALVGDPNLFIAEVDESDGSIARYNPSIAVVNNIALDHKTMEELRALFRGYVSRATTAVLNLDNGETEALSRSLPSAQTLTFSRDRPEADLWAHDIRPTATGVDFQVRSTASQTTCPVSLGTPGRHNVSNALAAIGACMAKGLSLEDSCSGLRGFSGIKRRLDVVGSANDITVIDDFAHNPDKIAASLATLHESPGRLIVLFQPHGFGPLSSMRTEFADQFAGDLAEQDLLFITEPLFLGGTPKAQDVTGADLASDIGKRGRQVESFADKWASETRILSIAAPGDRIVVMGARDDTLTEFAYSLLQKLNNSKNS